ncbi:MAG: PRC-barrel domain containing protein [Puniceicoccaceae bacterium]|nr:MAG: PRC-barrel domain containing protein [Puniceicoccaceae bacterium]
MKNKKIAPIVGVTASLFMSTALIGQTDGMNNTRQSDDRSQAQGQGQHQQGQQGQSQQHGQTQDRQGWGSQDHSQSIGKAKSASDIVGLDIKDSQDESIGTVDAVYLDLDSGEIAGVVVSSGGVMGFGSDKFVMSIDGLRYDENEEALRSNQGREALQNSIEYESDSTDVFRYFREQRSVRDGHRAQSSAGNQPAARTAGENQARTQHSDQSTDLTRNQGATRDRDQNPTGDAARSGDQNRTQDANQRTYESTRQDANRSSDQDRSSSDRREHMDRKDNFKKASDLAGLDVVAENGEKAGKVDDVYIDLTSGKVLGLVVSAGGFMDGDKAKFAVDLKGAEVKKDEDTLRINKSESDLRNAPEFKDGETDAFQQLRSARRSAPGSEARRDREGTRL